MLSDLPRLHHKLRNQIRDLRKASMREELQQYVAEGPHLAMDIAKAGAVPIAVVVRDDADELVQDLAERLSSKGADVFACGQKDMERATDTSSPQSILCVMPFHPERPIGDRVLVLDAVSDPGNVGTMIRTAAWFGFSDVVLGKGCADLYNPKVIRSTVGAALAINVVRRKILDEWIRSLDDRPRFAAVARGGQMPSTMRDAERFILVVGSEAHGVSPPVLTLCTSAITIPGTSGIESLNAAMAATILCYEGRRR